MAWWEEPVRMMRLEYMQDLKRMRDSDLDELARSKRQDWHVNCEWVIGTPGIAPGLGHLTTFNTPKFEKYSDLGDFDLIREYLPHARRYGLHVLAYLNMHWYAYDFADRHPGWEQVLADGTAYGRKSPLYGSGTTFCVNSPWRDWAFDLVREVMKTGVDGVFLDGPVVYPGCCYCPACRERFQAEHNAPIPEREDWSDPLWKDFIGFREASLAGFLREARDAMREIEPEGVIFLNAGSWHGGAWRVARDIETVGPYQNFNGAEAFFHPGPREHINLFSAVAAKHLVAGGKPAVVFSDHALGAWHYLPLPPAEAQLAIAQTVACGANPWFAIFDYSLDHAREESLEPIRAIQGFLEENEEYYVGSESAASVALLYSSQTNRYYVSKETALYHDPGSVRERDLTLEAGAEEHVDWPARKRLCDSLQEGCFLGFFTTLSRAHIPFDVILESALNRRALSRYEVVILPNAACLSLEQAAAIREFVEHGGNLLATFESGRYDERGREHDEHPLAEVLGLEAIEGAFAPAAAEEYMEMGQATYLRGVVEPGAWLPRPVYALQARPDPEAAVGGHIMRPLGKVYVAPRGPSEFPAVWVNSLGIGQCAYLPHLLGHFIARYKLPQSEGFAAGLVRSLHGDPLPLRTEGALSLQIELRRQSAHNRLIVHFVNHTGDMQRPIAEIVPLFDVQVWFAGPEPRSIRLPATNEELTFLPAGEGGWIRVPRVDLYQLMVVQY